MFLMQRQFVGFFKAPVAFTELRVHDTFGMCVFRRIRTAIPEISGQRSGVSGHLVRQ